MRYLSVHYCHRPILTTPQSNTRKKLGVTIITKIIKQTQTMRKNESREILRKRKLSVYMHRGPTDGCLRVNIGKRQDIVYFGEK